MQWLRAMAAPEELFSENVYPEGAKDEDKRKLNAIKKSFYNQLEKN